MGRADWVFNRKGQFARYLTESLSRLIETLQHKAELVSIERGCENFRVRVM